MQETTGPGFHLRDSRKKVVGGHSVGGHRSGWPYVVSILREHERDGGILLDDYVEQTFKPGGRKSALTGTFRRIGAVDRRFFPDNNPPIWRQPWVGVFHNPPNFPEWFDPAAFPPNIYRSPRFAASRKHLKGAVALSEYLAESLRSELGVPVVAVKHPAEFPDRVFSWDAFEQNEKKRLVQVGWFIRNYRAIYQAEAPSFLTKTHLAQEKPWIVAAARRTDERSPFRDRKEFGTVDVISWLENDEYDRLLTENIMFLEVFDASANNAIIEAATRFTPVVVNRHPAVVEYLGSGYPLYFDDIGEVAELLTLDRIRAAYEHLRSMDKKDLTPDFFVDRVTAFIDSVAI